MAIADLAGWIFRLHALVHPGWNAPAAVFSAALCLLFAGLALLAPELLPSFRPVRLVLSGLIVIIALIAIAENLFHRNLGLDLPLLHSEFLLSADTPGRMSMNLAIALLFLGAALLVSLFSMSRRLRAVLFGFLGLVCLLGVAGLWAYWRDMQWIYERTSTPEIFRMAPDAAVLLVLLSVGLWAQLRLRFGAPLREASDLALQGFRPVAGALVAIVLLAYVIALVVFQSLSLNLAAADLFRSLESRRSLIRQSLATASSRAQASTFPAEFSLPLRLFDKDPHSPRAVAQLYSASQTLAQRGLPAVAVEGADRGFLAMGGFVSHPAAQLDVHGQTPARLLWANGYKLDLGIPVRDAAGLAGVVVVQQPLEDLDDNAFSVESQDAATLTGICGPADGSLSCFPPQALAAGFTLVQASGDTLLPVHLATRNREGTAPGFDPQGNRVLVAYGPIAATGLGIVVERRVSTLFAPVRSRLQFVNVWLAVLLPCSLWAVRRQFQKQASALKQMSALYSGSMIRLELPTRPEFLTDAPRPRIAVPSPDLFHLPLEPVPVRAERPDRELYEPSPDRAPFPGLSPLAPDSAPGLRPTRPLSAAKPSTPPSEPAPSSEPRPTVRVSAQPEEMAPSSVPAASVPTASMGPSQVPVAPRVEAVRPGATAGRAVPSHWPPAASSTSTTSDPAITAIPDGRTRVSAQPVSIPAPSVPRGPAPTPTVSAPQRAEAVRAAVSAAHAIPAPAQRQTSMPAKPAINQATTASRVAPSSSASVGPLTRVEATAPGPTAAAGPADRVIENVSAPAAFERDAWGQPLTFEDFLSSVLLALNPPPPEPQVVESPAELKLPSEEDQSAESQVQGEAEHGKLSEMDDTANLAGESALPDDRSEEARSPDAVPTSAYAPNSHSAGDAKWYGNAGIAAPRRSPSRQPHSGRAGSGFKVSRMMVFLTLTGAFAAGVAITTGILGQADTDEPELP